MTKLADLDAIIPEATLPTIERDDLRDVLVGQLPGSRFSVDFGDVIAIWWPNGPQVWVYAGYIQLQPGDGHEVVHEYVDERVRAWFANESFGNPDWRYGNRLNAAGHREYVRLRNEAKKALAVLHIELPE